MKRRLTPAARRHVRRIAASGAIIHGASITVYDRDGSATDYRGDSLAQAISAYRGVCKVVWSWNGDAGAESYHSATFNDVSYEGGTSKQRARRRRRNERQHYEERPF